MLYPFCFPCLLLQQQAEGGFFASYFYSSLSHDLSSVKGNFTGESNAPIFETRNTRHHGEKSVQSFYLSWLTRLTVKLKVKSSRERKRNGHSWIRTTNYWHCDRISLMPVKATLRRAGQRSTIELSAHIHTFGESIPFTTMDNPQISAVSALLYASAEAARESKKGDASERGTVCPLFLFGNKTHWVNRDQEICHA